MIVAEDSGRVAIGKGDLNGVVANFGGGLRARLSKRSREGPLRCAHDFVRDTRNGYGRPLRWRISE